MSEKTLVCSATETAEEVLWERMLDAAWDYKTALCVMHCAGVVAASDEMLHAISLANKAYFELTEAQLAHWRSRYRAAIE